MISFMSIRSICDDAVAAYASQRPFKASDVLTDKVIHYRCYNFLGRKMSKAETNQNSDWKDGFLFLGNHLALDFLNTRPVQNGEATELLPDFSALLRWFQAADLLSSREAAKREQDWGRSGRAKQTLEAMRDLRERLRKEVL